MFFSFLFPRSHGMDPLFLFKVNRPQDPPEHVMKPAGSQFFRKNIHDPPGISLRLIGAGHIKRFAVFAKRKFPWTGRRINIAENSLGKGDNPDEDSTRGPWHRPQRSQSALPHKPARLASNFPSLLFCRIKSSYSPCGRTEKKASLTPRQKTSTRKTPKPISPLGIFRLTTTLPIPKIKKAGGHQAFMDRRCGRHGHHSFR